jgi:Tol biopolymer transport system component
MAPVTADGKVLAAPRPHVAPYKIAALATIVLALLTAGVVSLYFLTQPAAGPQLPTMWLAARGAYPQSSSLSPDGTRLAFIDGIMSLVIRDLNEKNDQVLVHLNEEEGHPTNDNPPVWSPEGRRLAYILSTNPIGEYQVRVVDSKGGTPEVIFKTADYPVLCDWSPDGDSLLLIIWVEGEESQHLVELSLSLSTIRELTRLNVSWPWRAVYSPDGKGVVYGAKVEDRNAVFILNRESCATATLGDSYANDDSPLWSSDGRFVLFRSKRLDSWDFWVMEVDGLQPIGGPYIVKENVGENTFPWDWSGEWLLYSESRSQNKIYELPVDSTDCQLKGEPAPFSRRFERSMTHGVPSRSGNRVCVAVPAEGGRVFYAVSPYDSKPLPIPVDSPCSMVIGWGPEDSWVLLWGRNDEEKDIFARVYVDTEMVEQIPVEDGPPLMGHFADLSPDGTRMALEEGPYNGEREVVIVTLAYGKRRPLGIKGLRLMSTFSPDGGELAVARNLDEGESDMVVVSLNGEPSRRLAQWGADFGNIGPPTWSPDGRNIVFISHPPNDDGHNRLMALSADVPGPPRLLYEPDTENAPTPWKPYWSPDGSQIFFTGLYWENQTWMMRDFLSSF